MCACAVECYAQTVSHNLNLIHWYHCLVVNQPELHRFGYRLVVGLPGEDFQLECIIFSGSADMR